VASGRHGNSYALWKAYAKRNKVIGLLELLNYNQYTNIYSLEFALKSSAEEDIIQHNDTSYASDITVASVLCLVWVRIWEWILKVPSLCLATQAIGRDVGTNFICARLKILETDRISFYFSFSAPKNAFFLIFRRLFFGRKTNSWSFGFLFFGVKSSIFGHKNRKQTAAFLRSMRWQY